MFSKFKAKLKKSSEIVALTIVILITVAFTSYYNFTKSNIIKNYKNIINNVYFKKTSVHIFENLEPRFKKINHQISEGETFDNILQQYSIQKNEITQIKKQLLNKIKIYKRICI